MTVFLTTHYMEEAEGSDRVVIIDGGKIAAEGTPVQLKNLYGEADALAASLRAAGIPCEREAEGVRVPMQDAAAAREFLMRRADLADDFEFIKGNMDDVFLSVTGRKWSEGGEA